MRGFHTSGFQLSGFGEQRAENTAESWKRFVTAALMATAALLLCAIIVVILALLLPHPAYVTHVAVMGTPPLTRLVGV